MSYADVDFYRTEFKGKSDDVTEIERCLHHASYKVDKAADYRIGDLESWPPFTIRQVKLATCAQAEHDAERGDLDALAGAVSGYTIGDVTLTGLKPENADDGILQHYGICRAAYDFLLPTGLLDRRRR